MERQQMTAELEATVEERTQRLAESLMQMRAILESSNDGILSVDEQCRVNFLNPAAEKMLCVKAEFVVGLPVGQVMQVKGRDGRPVTPELALLGDALKTASTVRMEDQILWRTNDTSFPAECVATPIYVERKLHGAIAKKLYGAMLTFSDTSQRIEIDRMKSEFISIVGHELKTPLASIRGVLGLLGAGKIGGIDEESRQLVQLAVRNADRLSRLINSIVDMQRMESGQMRLQQSFVGAHELVRRTNQRVREMADEAGVKLKYVVQNMQLQVDLERVVQVLDNLIQNAVKYSAPGQTVTVSALRGPEVVLFSVKDQGPGIAAEMQPRIFERFFQGDSTDARNKGGTGLGLTIARGIVQRHGGKIWVESREGEGATFFVELPQRRKRKAEKTPGL